MPKQFVLTEEGLRKLEVELETLKTERRKEVAEKIKTALSFGDLSENSEYDEAKNEQAMIESRIAQIETMLKNAKRIDDEDVTTETVNVGTRVRVLDVEFNEEFSYSIVGSTEADPDQNRISDESPIGKALLGHRVDDTVTVEPPSGCKIEFKILEISK